MSEDFPRVERVALTKEMIADYDLPTRPTKREGNRHAKGFRGRSVELDALPARVLRELVKATIEFHIKPRALKALRRAEESERQLIETWAAALKPEAAP